MTRPTLQLITTSSLEGRLDASVALLRVCRAHPGYRAASVEARLRAFRALRDGYNAMDAILRPGVAP
jgi:hypothetical protein